ncbi:MAG: hypothetical protein JWL84_527 [Rhodospirillales bacterium]|nr:hypothetical protein [Rhodospirillales bacterium]
MRKQELTFDLAGAERPDGTIYFTCKALPGFHFIVAEGEDPSETMRPVLIDFVGRYMSARLQRGDLSLRESPQRHVRHLELALAV